MNNELIKHFRAERWFYLFMLVHLICWTLAPIIVRYNLPLDSIEGTVWGHQLEWGYDKNPFLNGWLTALATYLGGQSGWMVYLFSQLSVAACLFATWQLAKNMLAPAYALIAVLILEGIQYYNFHAIDFNDNTLELSLWSLTIYFFYRALRTPNKTCWVLTGFFAGFGMMAKYYTAALLAGMALFFFLNKENRRQLKTVAPYLGLLTFLVIILPHTIWLCFHEFITITYVFERAGSIPNWTNHLFFPAQFAWQMLEAFLPALILFALVLPGTKPILNPHQEKLSAFNRNFLLCVGLGPFLMTVLLSLVMGITLRAGWGMPLLSTWGIILVALIQPNLTMAKMRRFIASIFIVMGMLLSGYSISLINSSDASSANFPGREVAQTITKTWHEKYGTPLAFVAGSRWIGGNIEFYSDDHPAVFIEWDKRRAPWIDANELQRKGAVFVWEMSRNEVLPDQIKKQFPQLSAASVLEFDLKRNRNHLPPVKIGVAFLPPTQV